MTARQVTPIGHVRTAYTERSATPVQAALNSAEAGTVVLDPEFRDGLLDLDGFDFAWLLTWFEPSPDDPVPVEMRQVPFFLSAEPRTVGLFAMRGPRRPNPIGLHLVRIVALTDDGFTFAGVDMLDLTPVLDIKPWSTPFDLPHGRTIDEPVRVGWFQQIDASRSHTPESLRRRPS